MCVYECVCVCVLAGSKVRCVFVLVSECVMCAGTLGEEGGGSVGWWRQWPGWVNWVSE